MKKVFLRSKTVKKNVKLNKHFMQHECGLLKQDIIKKLDSSL